MNFVFCIFSACPEPSSPDDVSAGNGRQPGSTPLLPGPLLLPTPLLSSLRGGDGPSANLWHSRGKSVTKTGHHWGAQPLPDIGSLHREVSLLSVLSPPPGQGLLTHPGLGHYGYIVVGGNTLKFCFTLVCRQKFLSIWLAQDTASGHKRCLF